MKQRLDVRWTPDAEADVAGITDYIGDSLNANNVLELFDGMAVSLQSLPKRGRVDPEMRTIGIFRYLEILRRPWRMVYIIQDHDLWIMGVFDGRRNLVDLLFERLAR